MMYDNFKKILKSRLDEKRYYHSLCVADEAKRLAEKIGVDTQKAYLAGLLHDITKNAPCEEHLQIFTQFGIILNDIEKNTQKLWHAISGTAYIEHILGVSDPEILDAVRYHTTAKADMSPLCLVLYLADFTSRDRDYPDVDIMRGLVDLSFSKALIYALQYTIKDLTERKKAIHFDTLAAFNFAVTSEGNN
ncbi:MAG: bis(5'-nucleosyl)-tetraphosphatase (symmetrical) YqeK [Clostridia bacterium]|nr:bis(5'-nucleosyl)-tetraphosphatase (symmetrical) YqeK [Clostridia bacterium]